MKNPQLEKITSMIRWIARVGATLLLIIVIMLIFGEGVPSVKLTVTEIILFIPFLVMVAGLAVSWKVECLGGFLTVGGFIVFWAIDSIASGNLSIGKFFFFFPAVGVLFILCCLIDKKRGQPS
jgi:hypothetical protein